MSLNTMPRLMRLVPSAGRAEVIAGPSIGRRYASTEPAPDTDSAAFKPRLNYPYSARVHFPPETTGSTPLKRLLHPKNGWSVILHLQEAMRKQLDKQNVLKGWFGKSRKRVRTGSIVAVSTWNTPEKKSATTFTGVLMATKRSGIDTSIRLRNIINKLGVEMQFKVLSPMVKEIKIVKAAVKKPKSGQVRDLRQSKAYYIRDRPDVLKAIADAVMDDKKPRTRK